MNLDDRLRFLRVALIAVGVIFIVGIFAMMQIWPDGWSWTPRQPEYEHMILGVYATLGIFLIRAAKDPLANLSLIWFTIWSSLIHAVIMMIHGVVDETERANLIGDVPALILVALVLWWLVPKARQADSA